MQFTQVSGIVVQVLLLVLVGVGIAVAIAALHAAREVRDLVAQTRDRLIPLLDKADITVDAVNAEVLRVDDIVTQIGEVSGTVSSTTRVATEFMRSPVNKAAEMGVRLLGGLRHKQR